MNAIFSFFQTGGIFMYPILIVFTFGIAISIERYIKLSKVQKSNKDMWNKLHPVLVKGDFEQARKLTEKNDTSIGHLLNAGLELQGAVRRRDVGMEDIILVNGDVVVGEHNQVSLLDVERKRSQARCARNIIDITQTRTTF